MPVLPLQGAFEIVEIGYHSRVLACVEVAHIDGPIGGVGGGADAPDIEVVGGGGVEPCEREGIGGGGEAGASAEHKAVAAVFHLPSGGEVALVPGNVGSGGGDAYRMEVVRLLAGGNEVDGNTVDVDHIGGDAAQCGGDEGDVSTCSSHLVEGYFEEGGRIGHNDCVGRRET